MAYAIMDLLKPIQLKMLMGGEYCGTSQTHPYLSGRKIKHRIAQYLIKLPESGGLVLNLLMARDPKSCDRRNGNGRLITDLTQQSVEDILQSSIDQSFHQRTREVWLPLG
jgi:hypothetical protein